MGNRSSQTRSCLEGVMASLVICVQKLIQSLSAPTTSDTEVQGWQRLASRFVVNRRSCNQACRLSRILNLRRGNQTSCAMTTPLINTMLSIYKQDGQKVTSPHNRDAAPLFTATVASFQVAEAWFSTSSPARRMVQSLADGQTLR